MSNFDCNQALICILIYWYFGISAFGTVFKTLELHLDYASLSNDQRLEIEKKWLMLTYLQIIHTSVDGYIAWQLQIIGTFAG